MNTYIVMATPDELQLLKEMNLPHYPVIITGVGGTNVVNALRELPKDTRIINVGYAGSRDIPVGNVVRVGKSRLLHEVDYNEQVYEIGDGVTCYTSTDFVRTTDRRGCFDMELAFICSLGFFVQAYKKISDNCNYNQYEENIKPMKR